MSRGPVREGKRLRGRAGHAAAILLVLLVPLSFSVHGAPDAGTSPLVSCGRLPAPVLDECSGIVASRRFPGVYWVHNDSGDRARFFAIDARGGLLAVVAVDGARNADWEDIAVDDSGHVYLGDFGNNRNLRRDLVVYVVDEPDPRASTGPIHVPVGRRLPFHYTDQSGFPDSTRLDFDCEAFYWESGRLYLLTKHRSDVATTLYRLDPGAEGEQAIAPLGRLALGGPVTGADASRDGTLVAVLTYRRVLLFERPATGRDLLSGRRVSVPIEAGQCEGICFDGDRLLVTNEQGGLFCLPLAGLRTGRARGVE